jgi:hypothetical protein
VKSTLTISDYGIELESFGGNDNGGENSKNHDTGDAYKGAVTDALTKICSYLEIGMDVFKGKADKAAPQTTQSHSNGDDKPWLNEGTDQYKAAITKLKSGATTIDKIKLVMKVSKATETKLLEAVKS